MQKTFKYKDKKFGKYQYKLKIWWLKQLGYKIIDANTISDKSIGVGRKSKHAHIDRFKLEITIFKFY